MKIVPSTAKYGKKSCMCGENKWKLGVIKVPNNKKLRECLMELERENMEDATEDNYDKTNLHIYKKALIKIMSKYFNEVKK